MQPWDAEKIRNHLNRQFAPMQGNFITRNAGRVLNLQSGDTKVQSEGTNQETFDASTQYSLNDIEENEDYKQLCISIFKPLFNFHNKFASKWKREGQGENIAARMLIMILTLLEEDGNTEDDTTLRNSPRTINLTTEPLTFRQEDTSDKDWADMTAFAVSAEPPTVRL